MKRLIYSVIIASLLLTSGCGSFSGLFPTPAQKAERATIKVEQTKQDIEKKEDAIVEKGKSYIWAADYTLALNPTPTIYTEVAKSFTGRAISTLGSPEMAEIVQLREIVNNLTSTNKSLIIKGEKQLADKDEEVVKLQQQIKKLEDTLQVKENKLKQVNEDNAALATTWKKITNGFWWVVWIMGIGLLLSLLGKILPPPYNSIVGIFAFPFGLIVKLIHALYPTAKQVAGVVAEKTYIETKSALNNVVSSIEDTKEELKNKEITTITPATAAIPAIPSSMGIAAAPAVLATIATSTIPSPSKGIELLKANLRTNLDQTDKIVIEKTKQDLGYLK